LTRAAKNVRREYMSSAGFVMPILDDASINDGVRGSIKSSEKLKCIALRIMRA